MTESSGKRLRRVVFAVVLTLAAGLLVAFFSAVRRSDLVVEQATHQLRPGMSAAEVRQALHGVHYANLVTKGRGEYLFYGIRESVWVQIDGDHVVKVDRLPDDANPWEGMRRNWERRLRFVFSSD